MESRSSNDRLQSRPYRSKRRRPCDICRRRKHACLIDGEPPCRVCRELNSSCTFDEPPSKRRRRPVVQPASPEVVPPLSLQTSITGTEQTQDTALGTNGDVWAASWPLGTHHDGVNTSSSRSHGGPEMLVDPVRSLLDSSQHDIWYAASPFFYPSLGTLPQLGHGIQDSNYQQEVFLRGLNHSPSPGPITLDQASLDAILQDRSQRNGRAEDANDQPNDASPTGGQPIKSLEMLDNTSIAQYFGLSGEMDPYLLQYMQFSEDGSCNFGPFQYRRLAGSFADAGISSSSNEIPIHFMTSTPRDAILSGNAGMVDTDAALEKLVPPGIGSRLVGLFLRYTFPTLPVLSRSLLKIRTMTLIPKDKYLETLPSYLLAAVYASADSFRRYDPVLSVSQVNNEFPRSDLWNLAYNGIMDNIHTPRLAIVQAILIYLQRPMDETSTATTDACGRHWTLLGSAVQMAYQLGLHIDCQKWPLPPWEKRLRRRLWWVLHTESTWQSLLLGLPQPISTDQWDVSELKDGDFIIEEYQCPTEETSTKARSLQKPCAFCHLGHDFVFLAGLSLIAQDIYQSFYTLASTKKLAKDFGSSLLVGRRLLESIKKWKGRVPYRKIADDVPSQCRRDYFHSGSSSQLRLACLTLEAMIYRAMLRPLAKSEAGLTPTDERDISEPDHERVYQASPISNASRENNRNPSVSEMFREATDAARRATSFGQQLGSYDLNSFSYSWSRACFASISNFVMFLLLSAPSADLAKDVLSVLARWVIMLREQCVTFAHMRLGLLRLDAVFQMGLEQAFRFQPHVRQTIQQELPTPSYKK